MTGMNGIFSRGLDGLKASSKGMTVVSNNIANMNTKGYARQSLQVGARPVQGDGSIGGGVLSMGITNMVNPFIDMQIVQESNQFGTLDGRTQTISHMEEMFNEANKDGVDGAMQEFFQSWNDLSSDPASTAQRQNVKERANILIDQFKSMGSQLEQLKDNVSSSIESEVDSVNALTEEIAQLNDAITNSSDESTQLDLKTKRQVKLQELSEAVGIDYHEKEDGSLSIQLNGGGMNLVKGSKASEISLEDDKTYGGKMSVKLSFPESDEEMEVTSLIDSGRLGGKLTDRNETIIEKIEQMDELAHTFVEKFNEQHQQGYGLGDNPDTNINFFAPITGGSENAASKMKLSEDIKDSLKNIAAAGDDPDDVGVGNNENALALLELQDEKLMDDDSQTFSDYYRGMTSEIGVMAGNLKSEHQSQSNVLNQLNIQRENISGVNLDEEAADLIRYQRAFQGASRVMSVANDMLDQLMRI